MDLLPPIQNHLEKGVNLLLDLASFPSCIWILDWTRTSFSSQDSGDLEWCQIINKPKHPQKKGEEYKEQNGRTHV
jgi:hypothetical protein